MNKIVSNQLSPNFNFQDALFAASCIGKKKPIDPKHFEQIFGTKNNTLFNAARSGLGLIAEELKAQKKTGKIGIPAFCCAVMATPFLTQGFEIEWIDTDDQGMISLQDFEKKAKNICCVIAPHTFGVKAPLAEISKIAKKNNIWIIEDCAHFFKSPAPEADFTLYSFGREKDVSCVSGGALVWKQDIHLRNVKNSSNSWTFHHLLQPLIYALALPWWHAGGKFIPALFAKVKFLPKAVTPAEKKGKEDFPKEKMAPSFQWVLKKQVEELNQNIEQRKTIAEAWKKVLSEKFPKAKIIIPENYFRVIVTDIDREKIMKQLPKEFHLAEWDGKPIAPAGVELKQFGYTPGQCPETEKFATHYLTFPTNKRVTLKDVAYFDTMFRA